MFIKKEISELTGYYSLNELNTKRQTTKILIIDDEPFNFIEPLRKLQFNIEYKQDIDNLSDISGYNIILSDIRGVGRKFSEQFGGAFLVNEIKKNYPEKIAIIYTANDYDPPFQQYFKKADFVIEKGTSIEAWTNIFDRAICDLYDPVKIWKKFAANLIEEGMSTSKISKLESSYVSSIIKNNNNKLVKIIHSSSFENYRPILENLMQVTELILKIKG